MLKIYFIYKVAGKNPEGLSQIELCRLPLRHQLFGKNRADVRDGNEYKIRKWLVLKFHGSGHLLIILHLNKTTKCLKMTTFKIVVQKNI
jgi:hypothetical protein